MNRFKEFFYNPAKIFVLMALSIGLMFSLTIPLTRVPDESTHIRYMLESFSIDPDYSASYVDKNKRMAHDTGIPRFHDVNKDRSLEDETYLDLKEYLYYGLDERIGIKFKGIPYNPRLFAYIPPFIGFFLGAFFNLPFIAVIQLGEISALLCYIFIGYHAIKTAPLKKHLFCFFLLSPMCMQLAASYNYDSLLISLSTFLLAYVLRIKADNNVIGWKRFIFICFITFVLLVIKLPYALLGCIIFTVPIKNISLPIKISNKTIHLEGIFKKFRIPICLAGILLGLPLLAKIDPINGGTLLAALSLPRRTFSIITHSFVEGVSSWKSLFYGMVGFFGIFDVRVSFSYAMLFLFILAINLFYKDKNDKSYNLGIISRCFIVFYCLVIMYMVYVSQFIWTFKMNDISLLNVNFQILREYILNMVNFQGVQGRYYIPVIMPVFFAFIVNKGYSNKNIVSILSVCFYILSLIYIFIILLNHYWV